MNGGLTLMTTDPFYQNTIGQRTGLSFMDARLINLLYCNSKPVRVEQFSFYAYCVRQIYLLLAEFYFRLRDGCRQSAQYSYYVRPQ